MELDVSAVIVPKPYAFVVAVVVVVVLLVVGVEATIPTRTPLWQPIFTASPTWKPPRDGDVELTEQVRVRSPVTEIEVAVRAEIDPKPYAFVPPAEVVVVVVMGVVVEVVPVSA